MKDLDMLYDNCKTKLDDINIQCGTIVGVTTNSRSKRRWGRCTHLSTGGFKIEISTQLLNDDVPDIAAETTMIHELLHTCKGCQNHGTEWKRLANKVNKAYGYNITRTTSAEEKGVSQEVIMKHKIVCQSCGKEIYRMRESKLTKYTNLYMCTCGGNLKKIY